MAMMKYTLRATLFFFFSTVCVLLNAQTNTSINGFIKTAKGNILQGAAVNVKNESTGFVYKGISNLKGFY
jgi:hypothetical protein